jgi:large conductance mechanosensitive channel
VNDILMPPLGLLIGNINFSDLFINLSDTSYVSLAEAKGAGAPTLNYGLFIQSIIDFLLVAIAIFIVVKQLNRLKREPSKASPSEKECAFCASTIPIKATRCPHCTSELKAA